MGLQLNHKTYHATLNVPKYNSHVKKQNGIPDFYGDDL